MKTFIIAGALVAATATAALAEGPRASSENNWPGASQTVAPAAATGEPHYVQERGYDRHGNWRSHWVLAR